MAWVLVGPASHPTTTSTRELAGLFGNVSGVALIVFSAFIANESAPIWDREPMFFVTVGLPCLAGLLLTWFMSGCIKGISKPERVAIAIECCYQNVGIASSVALSMYTGDEANEAMGVPVS